MVWKSASECLEVTEEKLQRKNRRRKRITEEEEEDSIAEAWSHLDGDSNFVGFCKLGSNLQK